MKNKLKNPPKKEKLQKILKKVSKAQYLTDLKHKRTETMENSHDDYLGQ